MYRVQQMIARGRCGKKCDNNSVKNSSVALCAAGTSPKDRQQAEKRSQALIAKGLLCALEFHRDFPPPTVPGVDPVAFHVRTPPWQKEKLVEEARKKREAIISPYRRNLARFLIAARVSSQTAERIIEEIVLSQKEEGGADGQSAV